MAGPVTCDICGATFKNLAGLGGHKRFRHSVEATKTEDLMPTQQGYIPHIAKRKRYKKKEETSQSTEELKEPETTEIKPEKEKHILTVKPVSLTGRDSHMAEILINTGFAKDYNDLQRKGVKLAFALLNVGGLANMAGEKKGFDMNDWMMKKMIDAEDNPMKAMKEFAMIKGLMGNQNNDRSNDLLPFLLLSQQKQGTDPMLMMMLMQGQKKEENGQKLDPLAMMYMMSAQQKGDPEIKDLVKEIIKAQSNQMNKKDFGADDWIKIWANNERAVKEKDLVLQQQREQHMRDLFDLKLRELEKDMLNLATGKKSNMDDIDDFKKKLQTVRDLGKEIGDKEKGGWDYIESIGKAVSPALSKIAETVSHRNQEQVRVSPEIMKEQLALQQPQNPLQDVPLIQQEIIPNKNSSRNHKKLIPDAGLPPEGTSTGQENKQP